MSVIDLATAASTLISKRDGKRVVFADLGDDEYLTADVQIATGSPVSLVTVPTDSDEYLLIVGIGSSIGDAQGNAPIYVKFTLDNHLGAGSYWLSSDGTSTWAYQYQIPVLVPPDAQLTFTAETNRNNTDVTGFVAALRGLVVGPAA